MVPDPSSGAWPRIRYDYEHTDRPVDAICAEHRISAGTLRNRIRRWNWTRRRPPVPREGPPPAPAPQFGLAAPLPATPPPAPEGNDAAPAPAMPPGAPGETADPPRMDDAAAIVPRLQTALSRVLPAIEATVARLGEGPIEAHALERAARTLVALARAQHAVEAASRAPRLPLRRHARGHRRVPHRAGAAHQSFCRVPTG